jgi:type II secretory pathway component GspD/PulD (secretin)
MKKRQILFLLIILTFILFSGNYSKAYQGLVSISAENEELSTVLYKLAEDYDLNIVISKSVSGNVTVKLSDVTLEDALTAILQPNNYAFSIEGDVVSVYSYSEFQQIERFSPLVTKVFTLQNTDVSSLRRTFQSMKSSRGKMELNLKGNQVIITDTPDKIKQFERVLKELDTRRELKKYKLKYAEAADVIDKISQLIPEDRGDVFLDERTNSIVVKAATPLLQNVDELVKGWDVQHKQVMIEAKILEVTLDNNLQLGIDWEYDSPDTAKKGEPAKVDLKGEFPLDLTDGGIFQIGTLSSDDYQVTLEMLETNSNTEVLSSPRVVVIDNHEASILVGSEEPYITTSTDPDTGWVYEETQFKNVGLQLIVTPKIDEDNYITMTVHPEVSTARRVAEVDNALAIDTTQADTTMMVRDGETIVLGGLMKDTKSNTDKKIPILGDIPILGYLFRSTEQETKKTEILVFITPHILTNENREEISAQEIEDVMERSQTTFDLICEEVDFEQEETTF